MQLFQKLDSKQLRRTGKWCLGSASGTDGSRMVFTPHSLSLWDLRSQEPIPTHPALHLNIRDP